MKTLLVSLVLLLLSFHARAQRPEIIGFAEDGTLTWTNGTAGGYWSVESTPDLSFMWWPFTTDTWSQATSSSTGSCKLDLSRFDEIDIPIAGIADLLSHHFFRVVASSHQIPLPVVTNTIRITNHSSDPLVNLAIGSITDWNHFQVTNIPSLPPEMSTDWVDVPVPFSFIIAALASGSNMVGYSHGWYLTYDQNGTNRTFELPMMALGPVRKEIACVASNNSITATWTWLKWWPNMKQW